MNQVPSMPGMAERELTSLTINRFLEAAVATCPERVAVRDEHQSLTYREFWDESARLAGGLAEVGVAEGDHVATMLDNSVDYALTVIALNFLGAVVVPINTGHKGSILEHIVRDSGAAMAVVESGYLDTMSAAGPGVLGTIVVRGADERGQVSATEHRFDDVRRGPARTPVPRHVWDTAMIGYTSGTTGLSKGVKLSNGYVLAVADPVEVQGVVGEYQVNYVVCPMFHLTGMSGGLFSAIVCAGTAHFATRFSTSTFMEDATRAGATNTVVVGTMADFVLRQPPRPSDAACTLRTVAMYPLHPRFVEFNQRFACESRTTFGGTESGAILVTSDEKGPARGSCGRARVGFEVRIVDDFDIEVPHGEVGELVVRCDRPWLIGGEYVGNPEATAAAWRNGWFHFGDLLRRDEDGYFYFVDRKKDAIRRRGENVSSVEVEREVLAHAEVLECAAVAAEADHMEQEVKVFVIRTPGSSLSEADLIAFLAERMPRYSVPRFVHFLDDLPRTSTGKVRKDVLRSRPNSESWDREKAGIILAR